ncbi:MAG: SDR family NAD(P)-dependent oxidoreductase, partial [Anaerolineae bacterium]
MLYTESPGHPYSVLRNRYFLLADLLLVALAAAASFYLRLDAEGIVRYRDTLMLVIVLAILIKPPVFYFFGLYRRYWRYASVDDLLRIVFAVSTAFLVTAILEILILPLWLDYPSVPRSIPIIDWLLTLALVGGVRFAVRLLARRAGTRIVRPAEAKRVLVMGAGDAGAMIVREMRNNPQLNTLPVGFVDDNAAKSGMTIHDVPVLGTRQDIPALVERETVDEVIIAMPTASGKDIRAIMAICQSVGVRYKTIPGVFELISGQVSVKQIRDVQVEDLLRRDPVEADITPLVHYLSGARVLVTGAGGSIGSEICRQVASYRPRQLVLLGHGENSIYQIERELRQIFPALDLVACIADVRDPQRLEQVFARYRPAVVFHAAAHKHVPLMESNVTETVTNNILGTQLVLKAAIKYGVGRFVLISTDKAVNPVSGMGASKLIAEMLVQDAAQHAHGVFVAVRFGNVLGSRGSVVPLFKEQIAAGGPITITDPNMERYFMTIPEATNLV